MLKTKIKQLLAKYKIFCLAWCGLFVLGDNLYIGFLFHILPKTSGLRTTKINTFSKVYSTESTIRWRKKSFSFSRIGVDIYHAARYIAVVRYEAQVLIKYYSYILLLSYNFIKHSMVAAWQTRSLLHWHNYSSEWKSSQYSTSLDFFPVCYFSFWKAKIFSQIFSLFL